MLLYQGPVILELPLSDERDFSLLLLSDAPPALMAKADAPGERWITLSPRNKHGEKGEGGVHVKIKTAPDGSAHVISGPGELRGLRLTRLASPEELAERRKKRDEERKNKRKEEAEAAKKKEEEDTRRAAEDPEFAQQQARQKIADKEAEAEKQRQLEELGQKAEELRSRLLNHAAELTGDDAYQSDRAEAFTSPEAMDDYKERKRGEAVSAYASAVGQTGDTEVQGDGERAAAGAGAVIASRNVRQIKSGLDGLRKDLVRNLIQDDELRGAVLGEEDTVDPATLETGKPSGSPGYKRQASKQALDQGFTPQDAKAEAGQVFAERIQKLAVEQPDRAKGIVTMREATLDRAAAEREIKAAPATATDPIATTAPVRKVAPTEIKKKAEQVREFLKTHNELKELERQMRRVRLGHDPEATDKEKKALEDFDGPLPPGAELGMDAKGIDDAAFVQRLEAEIKDAAKQDLTRAFLDSIDEDTEHSGYAGDVIRKAMHAHIGVGAHAHLANVALAALGHEGLDRQVVDTLGVEAAAQLVAHALRRDSHTQQFDDIRAGLAQHHDEHSLKAMQEAMELASAARADAAEIDLPEIGSGTDAAAVMQLNKERKARISEAHEALGTALGQVEAGAALNMALTAPRKHVAVRMGATSTAAAATALRALGLQDGEYKLEKNVDSGDLNAYILPAGMDRLTQPLDEQRQSDADTMRSIKNGEQDEPTYLPAGFVQRPDDSFNEAPQLPTTFALPLDLSQGVEAGVDKMIASRAADGWEPSEIYQHLRDDVAPDLTPEQSQALFSHLSGILPITRAVQRTAEDGSTYTAHEAQDIDRMPEVRQRLYEMAQAHVAQHHPGDTTFNAQHIDDDSKTREAVFRTLAANPTLGAAFAAPSDLGGDSAGRKRAKAIKRYAEKHILSQPKEEEGLAPDVQAKLDKLGEAPDKWGSSGGGGMFDMFGGGDAGDGPTTLKLHDQVAATAKRLGESYSPEQRRADEAEQRNTHERALAKYGLKAGDYELRGSEAVLTEDGKHRLTLPSKAPTYGDEPGAPEVVKGGLEGLNPAWVEHHQKRNAILEEAGQDRSEPVGATTWPEFVEQMGGPKRAYAAVQEKMQSDFMHAFHEHYGAVTGQSLKISKARTAHGERLLATMNPARLQELRRDRAKTVAKVRQRSGGKFAAEGEGAAAARADKAQADASAAQMQLGSLFGASAFSTAPDAQHGGEVQAQEPRHLDVREDERYTLGHGVESRLAQMVNHTPLGVKPTDSPVGLIRNLSWGQGKHIGKQRGVKALLQTGRLLGFYGAGSGKTGMQIGGFTQAHAEGKARKAILVCPSIVRNQFGEEAARFTEPGKYSWHAHDDTFEGRKAAMTGDTHMVVMTHQTFRDDMVKYLASHQGVSETEAGQRFERMDRPARAAALKAALDHHGIPMDYLAIDEAHDFLNRAGKQDSLMSKVAEAAMDNARYKSLWTGSPVKNDPSEVHDWLSKVDPERFSDRDAFMRRYGVNTTASAEALQRLMDSYSYVDSVRPEISRTVTWGRRDEQGNAAPIPLTPKQQEAYQGVLSAFQRASKAKREGRVDVEACKTLSPNSFADADPAEHERIAAGLMNAIGTLKHSALGRVVNEFPAEHNAKVQHVLEMAQQRKSEGKGGVVFARNRASVAMLKEELEKKGLKVGVIDGSTSTEGKGQVRNSFDRGEVDVVVCSDAGATGANLQKRGQWLVNYDLPLTQKTLEQRGARIDRLGQDKHIELHHLQTDTPYDSDNVKRLAHKRELGEILQGEFRSMDDRGIAGYLHRARAERNGEPMESWAEPLTPEAAPEPQATVPPAHENAKPAPKTPDLPEVEWGDPPAEEPEVDDTHGMAGLFG